MSEPIPILEPCDILVYFTWCVPDVVIAVKTFDMAGHIEIAWEHGLSAAARSKGVNLYPFRKDGLQRILRPKETVDFAAAKEWYFKNAHGKKYNWMGLGAFDWPGDKQLALWDKWEKDRWFCSELACDMLRAAKTHPFAARWPSIKVPPALYDTSERLDLVWSKAA